MSQPTTIAIAGASGFIGQALLDALPQSHQIIALSRRPMPAPSDAAAPSRLSWRQANLFHLRQVERALAGAQVAIYLVHSMMPAARLSQGSFADLDLICADNFARAARAAGVSRIIYIGGLLPAHRPLSLHLRSRLEVEHALGQHGVPVTSLRAGIIFGPGGSSARMMLHLVERLPILVLPRWCRSRCQPTAVADILRVVHACIDDASTAGKTYDVGNHEILTYADMLRACAKALPRRRLFIDVPAFTPNISLWWVGLVTGTPMALVRPLVMSLQHDMVVRPQHDAKKTFAGPWTPFAQALQGAIEEPQATGRSQPTATTCTPVAQRARGVVSVQRMRLPRGRDAAWAATAYVRWLPSGTLWLRPFVRVASQHNADQTLSRVDFWLRGTNTLLLGLVFSPERSNPHRQLFYIADGLLARPTDRTHPGRFEFRSVLSQRYVLAAIHDFVPRLPWLLYKTTQAVMHALVMAGFARFMHKQAEQAERGDVADI